VAPLVDDGDNVPQPSGIVNTHPMRARLARDRIEAAAAADVDGSPPA
jgi:hypothetical protein